MARRLGDSIERGNLVLGTAPPTMGGFSSGMGGGGAATVRRSARLLSGSGRSIAPRPEDSGPDSDNPLPVVVNR